MAAATNTTPSKPKVTKQDTTKDPKDQLMEADPAKTFEATSDLIDIDSDDELLDPFSDQQKSSGDVGNDVLMQPGCDTDKVFKTRKPMAAKQKSQKQ